MVDRLTTARRAWLMGRVRNQNTAPELTVRALLHSLGFRFRIHRRDLPGHPDIVLPGRGAIVFVHGCFWHGHGCKIGKLPKSKLDYWGPKISANRQRDARNNAALRKLGWRVHEVWQCQTKDLDNLGAKLDRLLKKQRLK